MKKILYIFLAVLLVTGCDGMLDTKNYTEKDSANYPANPAEAEGALAGCYISLVQITQSENPLMVYELLSDNCLGGAGDGDLRAEALNKMKTETLDMFNSFWTQSYAGIFRCNLYLQNQNNVEGWQSANQKNQFVGELHFLRAYFYFEMCRMFGTVPLVVTTERENSPRASVDALFAQIAFDLQAAINTLPATKFGTADAPALGHATKWAAEALMARVFLFYTGYYKKAELPINGGGSISKKQVTDWLDDCIANSGHGLLQSDFRNLWAYSNEFTKPDYPFANDNNLKWIGEKGDNPETMFAIKFSSIASWGTTPFYGNQMCVYFGMRSQTDYANCFPFGLGWGVGTVNSELWDTWKLREPNDIRRKGSILDVNDPSEGVTMVSADGQDMDVTGYWQKKIMPINAKHNGNVVNYSVPMFGASTDVQLNNTQDIVWIRFADVLLMNAELKGSASDLNLVRARAGLAAVAYSDDALRNERRFELAFEGHRYHDLLRWGIAADALTKQNNIDIFNKGVKVKSNYGNFAARIQATGGFMPIPQREIDLSGGVLKQTPGWSSSDGAFLQ